MEWCVSHHCSYTDLRKSVRKVIVRKASTPKKGILLAIMAGIAIMFFYGLVVKSLDPQYVAGGTGTLTPYTGVFFFAVGILAMPHLYSIPLP